MALRYSIHNDLGEIVNTQDTITEEVANAALQAEDIPWGATPILQAGLGLSLYRVPLRTRLKFALKGILRQPHELSIITMNNNEFIFMGASEPDELLKVRDGAAGSGLLISSLIKADKMDGGGRSEALLWQWREACYAFSGCAEGDITTLDEPRDVETVDGRGRIAPGAVIQAIDVLFDEERSVLARSSEGDVFSVPAGELVSIAPRRDGSGRTFNGVYAYSKVSGSYVTFKEGETA